MNEFVYGGLVLDFNRAWASTFKPVTFPFDAESHETQVTHVETGNHIKKKVLNEPVTLKEFDYWHTGVNAVVQESVIPERGIEIRGKIIGHEKETTLRQTIHRVININDNLLQGERAAFLDSIGTSVLPLVKTPSLISLTIQSSQPKFVILSRDIPVYFYVFVDSHCEILIWSNEPDLNSRMHDIYKNRFAVYRMQPRCNCAVVLHTYFLKKRLGRWNHVISDKLKGLNALECQIDRKTKYDDPNIEATRYLDVVK